jgi:hypothetical protein
VQAFVGAAAVYAVGTAIIGASPAAFAADIMPKGAAGLGLGIYRCAGDLGAFCACELTVHLTLKLLIAGLRSDEHGMLSAVAQASWVLPSVHMLRD